MPHWRCGFLGCLLLGFLACVSPLALRAAADSSTKADPGMLWTRLLLEADLPAGQVRGIVQDRDGFIWFATLVGLVRFDGTQYRVFRHQRSDPDSLIDDRLLDLALDAQGNLWIAAEKGLDRWDRNRECFVHCWRIAEEKDDMTETALNRILADPDGTLWLGVRGGGLLHFDPRRGTAVPIRIQREDQRGQPVSRVVALCRDRRGHIWIGTSEAGLFEYEPKTDKVLRNFRHDPAEAESLSDNAVQCLAEGLDGFLWVGTSQGLNRLDPESGNFTLQQTALKEPGAGNIQCLLVDAKGSIWIGADGGGLQCFNPITKTTLIARASDADARSLVSNKIWSIFEDRNGDVWTGHHPAGVSYFNRLHRNFRPERRSADNPHSLSHRSARCFWEDQDGTLWVGTEGGLNRWDDLTGRWVHYQHEPADPRSLSDNAVVSIMRDRRNRLWVATWNGGLNLLDPVTGKFHRYTNRPSESGSLSNNHVLGLAEDARNRLLVATYEGGINRLESSLDRFTAIRPDPAQPRTSLNHERVWCLMVSHDGNLWAGTHGGLARSRDAGNTWDQFRAKEDAPGHLTKDSVTDLHESADGRIWVGTFGGGLNCLDPQTGRFQAYQEADGLPSNVVLGILSDRRGQMWISTDKGLCRLEPQSRQLRTYDESDGIPARQFNRGARLLRNNGDMVFGTVDGFVSFHPDYILPDDSKLTVVLTGFEISNRPQKPGAPGSPLTTSITQAERLDLPYHASVLSFRFAAIGYRAPVRLRCEYHLEGFDQDWQKAGAERRANYTNLDPGTYRLRVRAADREGRWFSNGPGLVVMIQPAWWQRWTFRVFATCGLFATALTIGWKVSSRRSRIRVREAERERTLAEERQRAAIDRENAAIEREKLQSQLVQAQKMDSIGRLAGGVAHDFNNMLQAILCNASLGLEERDCPPAVRENLEEIKMAGQRSAELTRQLLAFARKQAVSPKLLDLNETVAGMLKMLQRLIGEDIQLIWKPGQPLGRVLIDPSQVDQILANLTVNSRDAIKGTGKIIIETATATLDPRSPTHSDAEPPRSFVLLSISDTGSGMDELTRSRLFEPFFTTKKTGEGTGLGLATVYGIVTQNGGQISVYSEPGRGSTFKIYLPQVEGQTTVPAKVEARGAAKGHETILLVEDEPQILSIALRILTNHGYHVLPADSPTAALRLAGTHPGPIHLLITDVVMPDLDGKELHERIRRLKPGIRCLYMSGYTADVIVHHGVIPEGVNFIQKPFAIEMFTQAVRQVLEKAPNEGRASD